MARRELSAPLVETPAPVSVMMKLLRRKHQSGQSGPPGGAISIMVGGVSGSASLKAEPYGRPSAGLDPGAIDMGTSPNKRAQVRPAKPCHPHGFPTSISSLVSCGQAASCPGWPALWSFGLGRDLAGDDWVAQLSLHRQGGPL